MLRGELEELVSEWLRFERENRGATGSLEVQAYTKQECALALRRILDAYPEPKK